MLYFILGSIIGTVMGLTGAGGALISIPLFMHFLGMDLKQASVYSLSAVIFASLVNFFMQKKDAQIQASILIVLVSSIGSTISSPWKSQVSDTLITTLLIGISVFALINIWVKKKDHDTKPTQSSFSFYSILVLSGLVLGVLTTLTGLGGGVLMVPVMLRFLHCNHKQAIASSLLAVALSSAISLGIQVHHGFNFILDQNIGMLFMGMIFTAMLLKYFIKHVSSNTTLLLQRLVFSIVVLIAWFKLLT